MKDLLVHPKTTKTNFSFISAKKHKKGSLRSEPEWVAG